MRVSCAVETCSCGVGTFSCAVYAYSCAGDACVWMRYYAFSCGGPLLWGCITLQQWYSRGVSLPMHTPALFCGKRQGHCYAREFVPHGVSRSLLPAPPPPPLPRLRRQMCGAAGACCPGRAPRTLPTRTATRYPRCLLRWLLRMWLRDAPCCVRAWAPRAHTHASAHTCKSEVTPTRARVRLHTTCARSQRTN
jgi:hypothetical protein